MGIKRGERRDLTLVCIGGGVTWFGNALALISLMLVLRPAGGFALAGLFLADSVPLLVVAPLAGLLVDRLPNRKLMIAAQLGQGAAALGLALSLSDLPLVFAFVALLSAGNAIARPASSALIPALVGEDDATRGYSWISSSASTGLLLGTAAGGVLVAGLGAHDALLIDALTYAVQATTLLLVRADRRPRRHPDRPSAGRQILAGLRFLAADRVLIVGIGAVAVGSFAGTMVNVVEVFFVTIACTAVRRFSAWCRPCGWSACWPVRGSPRGCGPCAASPCCWPAVVVCPAPRSSSPRRFRWSFCSPSAT